MSVYDFHAAFKCIEKVVFYGNQYLSVSEFWKLDKEALNEVVFLTLETVRISSVLLFPFCPSKAKAVLEFLDAPSTELSKIKEPLTGYKLSFENQKIKSIKIE